MLFKDPQQIDLKPGTLSYFPAFIPEPEAIEVYKRLLAEIPWEEGSITLFGKTHKIPRLQAWYGGEELHYGYSGIKLKTLPFNVALQDLRERIEKASGQAYNSCLANLYRNGQDSMGWHADDEKELGPDPIIASLSLGAERKFRLKAKADKTRTKDLLLRHGDLLIMGRGVQRHWQHALPKQKTVEQGRINLTFRLIEKA